MIKRAWKKVRASKSNPIFGNLYLLSYSKLNGDRINIIISSTGIVKRPNGKKYWSGVEIQRGYSLSSLEPDFQSLNINLLSDADLQSIFQDNFRTLFPTKIFACFELKMVEYDTGRPEVKAPVEIKKPGVIGWILGKLLGK